MCKCCHLVYIFGVLTCKKISSFYTGACHELFVFLLRGGHIVRRHKVRDEPLWFLKNKFLIYQYTMIHRTVDSDSDLQEMQGDLENP